jgi:hypothetical protein
MHRVLHILTRPEYDFPEELASQQRSVVVETVEAVDLTRPAPDYKDLLRKIFEADSIECW